MQTVRKSHDLWKVATLIAAIFCAYAASNAAGIHAPTQIEIEIEEALTLEPDYKTTWISGGMKQTVTTYKLDTETYAEGSARHKAKVAAHLVEFPKDPEPV